MTKQETATARQLLESRTDRVEQVVLDAGGFALTAHWADGSGQKIFYTLDQVERHMQDHRKQSCT